jgi:tetratricopeptide (TPR) repeat protein
MNKYSKNRVSIKSTMSGTKKEQVKNSTLHRFLSYPYVNIFSFSLIALAAFIVYSNSFVCPFHFDDESVIVSNPLITRLSYFYNIDYWLSLQRPLAIFSFALNYHFSKFDVWSYHLVNLLIHIVAGIFVFLLIKLILDLNNYKNNKLDKHKYLFALLAALFFVVHPIQTQAITYIVQRMASMAAMFYIMSIYFYSLGRIAHVQNNKVLKAILLYLLALTSGILGVMTKQSAITFPFAFLLFEFCFIRSKENKIFKNYIIISLSALIVVCVSFLFFNGKILTSALHGTKISSMDYLVNQFVVIVKYLRLTVVPMNQCADYGNVNYGFLYIKSFWRFDVIGCFLLLLGLFTLAVYFYKKNKAFSFGIFWFFLTLSIESSIIPIADPMFEHRMYLPMVGTSIFFMSSLFMMLPKLKTIYIYSFIALVIFLSGILCYSRNDIWKNELTLWTDVTEKAPNNARAWYNKGNVLEKLGKHEEAMRSYDNAVEIQPEYYNAWNNKGNVLHKLGNYEEAIKCFDNVIEIKPDVSEAWNSKGNILDKLGKHEEAIQCYDKAIEIKPDLYEAWYYKGITLATVGKHEEAIQCYDKVIEIKPDLYEAWNNKGITFAIVGKHEEAVKCFDKVIEIKPEYFEAWYNKGNVLEKLGEHEEALKCFDKVIEKRPDDYGAWNKKGNVLDKLGKHEEAIQSYDKALQIQPNSNTARNNKFLAQQKIKIRQLSILKRSH